MENFTKEELTGAMKAITSMISKCEKAREKLAEGTSKHTLLKNRLKALYISLSLIERELEVEGLPSERMLDQK